MKNEIKSKVVVQRYNGPKKPQMAKSFDQCILPLSFLARQVVTVTRSKTVDFSFMQHIAQDNTTPEFGGFNTLLSRQQGHSIKPATIAIYTPLIDMVPSDPDTMMTAMVEAQRLTKVTGQTVTIFTADQQLYRVMIDITWVYPIMFRQFVPRLGGMHMLMSFVGTIGTLMSNSGLEDILKVAFGSVPKMLSGKKFPQNCRALRMVTEVLLSNIINNVHTHSDLMDILEDNATKSRTTKLWLDNLIKPVFLIMMFVRAEREADWPLHLWTVNEMMTRTYTHTHFTPHNIVKTNTLMILYYYTTTDVSS